jgi:uncharacterized protein YlxW (UPF0749 family)
MVTRLVLVGVCVAWLSTGALGQNTYGQPSPNDPVTREQFDQLMAKVDSMQKDIQALSDIHEEDRAQLAQLAKRDKNGRSYVRLDTSQEPMRRELLRAVKGVVPATGIVTIDNQMHSEQLIAINGKTYEVMAQTTRDVPVEYGQFRVRLPYQKTEVRHFDFPNETAVVRIQPAETVRWISNSPIYYDYVQW